MGTGSRYVGSNWPGTYDPSTADSWALEVHVYRLILGCWAILLSLDFVIFICFNKAIMY